MSTNLAPRIAAPDVVPPTELPFTAFERSITLAIVLAPLIAVAGAIVVFWGNGVGFRDAAIGLGLYVVAGYGITVGYHRMLTHRSFVPTRPVKILFAIAGSLAFEGGPISWVADHRRHHVFSDRAGDPHSPHRFGESRRAQWRGLVHAHVGWLFNHTRTAPARYARDLLDDHDLVVIDRLFPMWAAVSLALPFGLGYAFGHSLTAALTTLLWAGGVRIFVLHHVTWSINSLCHTFGRRPFPTRDQARNLAALGVMSFGESWHNGHHALPRSARHGLLPHQWDSSAALIRLLERRRWASDVVWPTPRQIAAARTKTTTERSRGSKTPTAATTNPPEDTAAA